MTETTRETFIQDIEAHEKCVVVFWKNNCPQCVEMKKRIAVVEKENPGIKVLYYNQDVPDDILRKFNFKEFPLMVIFVSGKIMGIISGLFEIENIFTPFLPTTQRKIMYFDLEHEVDNMRKEMNKKDMAYQLVKQSLEYESGDIEQLDFNNPESEKKNQ